tara:strand:- start:1377 stop:1829 length:453 start_codon:yes stop_codon:yes gene_type:complete
MSSNNKKIGYTTGVFDLFHVGHLEILRKAKENCDYLIVGVSTDELVQEYKNKRPIITFDQRIEIIKSIKYVDEVVVQKDRDKLSALHKIGFNIMFVGDDWKGSKIFLELESKFQKHGVEIFYFPYTKNISSTSLRSTLKRLIQEEEKDSN